MPAVPDLLWTQPGWLEQAHAWIEAELGRRNRRVIGPIEQPHIRPWSTVLRVPTDAGALFFKAVAPMLAHEPALTQALARWHPDQVLPVLAAEPALGWMLMPDGGTRLREMNQTERRLERWETLLAHYAGLQIDLASRTHQLLTLGAPDRRLARLPVLYRQLVADAKALGLGRPEGLTGDEAQRLLDRVSHVRALCARLADFRVPASLHHGDFHDGNVFVRDGRFLLFDWGDCSITHPFFSLRTALVSVEITFGLAEDDPALDTLRDVYLEPWTRFEPRERLLDAARLSRPLATLVSALSWHHVGPRLGVEHAHVIPSLLREFLELEQRV